MDGQNVSTVHCIVVYRNILLIHAYKFFVYGLMYNRYNTVHIYLIYLHYTKYLSHYIPHVYEAFDIPPISIHYYTLCSYMKLVPRSYRVKVQLPDYCS